MRSLNLDQFLPILRVPGVRFHSLQKGPAESQLADLPADVEIAPLGAAFDDLEDLVAAIGAMDLVISVCTGPAHIAGAMREAKRLAEEAAYGAPLDNRPPTDDVHSVARGTISGTVALDPALATRITGSEALFLYARPVLGGGPLAGLRTTVDKLPADFTLDDSLSPLPDNPLSSHDTVTLTARISPSGAAEPMPGDLEGTIRSVTVGSQGVKLVIDTVRP